MLVVGAHKIHVGLELNGGDNLGYVYAGAKEEMNRGN